jgi:hypothetical protein
MSVPSNAITLHAQLVMPNFSTITVTVLFQPVRIIQPPQPTTQPLQPTTQPLQLTTQLNKPSFQLNAKSQSTKMVTSPDGPPLLKVSKTGPTNNSLLVELRMIKYQPLKLRVLIV